RLTRAAVIRPASSRKARVTAAVAAALWATVTGSACDHGLDHDRPAPRPRLGHRQGLVQVRNLDLRIAADQLLAFHEETVFHDRLAVLPADRGGGLGSLQLVPRAHLGPVLGDPPPHLR